MPEMRVYRSADLNKMRENEQAIFKAISKVVDSISLIGFLYERKKIWKVVLVSGDKQRLEIPANQFSLYDANKFIEEFKKYSLAINLIKSDISIHHYASRLNYFVATRVDEARDIAVGWVRKALRMGLDASIEQGTGKIFFPRKLEVLSEFFSGRKGKEYIYILEKISVSVGFWSYDLLVGSTGIIFIVKNKQQKRELLSILREKAKDGTLL